MQRSFYEMPFEQRYIWGVTAGMLRALVRADFILHDPSRSHRDRHLSYSVRGLRGLFLLRDGTVFLVKTSWPMHVVGKMAICGAVACDREPGARRIFSGAPPGRPTPAHVENGKLDPGIREMSAPRALHNRGLVDIRSGLRVLTLLNADGEEARVVGGAVRNALLGPPVGEIDIATTALPEEVISRAKRARIKSGADRH